MNTNTTILATLEKEISAAGIYTGYQGSFFEKTLELLRANIREEEATKKGNKKPFKIIEKMIKGSNYKYQPLFKMCHPYGEKYGFLDSYRLFLSDDNLGYEVATPERAFKIEPLYNINKADYIDIEINIAELRYFSKVAKPRGKNETPQPFIIRTPDGLAGFNPSFLLDLIEYSGSNTIKYIKHNAPIYSNDYNALLLPVHLKENSEDFYNEYRAKWFDEKKEAAA